MVNLLELNLIRGNFNGISNLLNLHAFDLFHYQGDRFGTTTNSKGYKMLPPFLRVIQGDGITCDTIGTILEAMKQEQWSAENLTFGCGGKYTCMPLALGTSIFNQKTVNQSVLWVCSIR